MNITVLAFTPATSGTASTVTTAAVDTTGATKIVLSLTYNAGTPTILDSKGNSYSLVVSDTNVLVNALYQCDSPIVGTGHTFTLTAVAPVIVAIALSGAAAGSPSSTNSANTTFNTGLSPGSVTPTTSEAIIIGGTSSQSTGAITSVNTTANTTPEVGGTNYGGGMGYLITAGALNVAWNSSFNGNAASTVACFEAEVVSITGSASNTATFSQLASYIRARLQSVLNTLTFSQSTSQIHVRFRSLSNAITFSQVASATRILSKSVSNHLTLTQSDTAQYIANRVLTQHLTLVSSCTYNSSYLKSATNHLTFSQLAHCNVIRARSFVQTIHFTSSLANIHVEGAELDTHIFFSQFAFGIALGKEKYVLLQAPLPGIQLAVILPSPLFEDSQGGVSDVIVKKSMNNVMRTLVRRTANQALKYTFSLNRMKGLELEHFFYLYNASVMRLQNWKGEVWDVRLMNNPLEFIQNGRNTSEINLEFEGTKVY